MLLFLACGVSNYVTLRDTSVILPGSPTPSKYATLAIALTSTGRLLWASADDYPGGTTDVPGQWYVGPMAGANTPPYDVSFYGGAFVAIPPGAQRLAELSFSPGATTASIPIQVRAGNGDPSGVVTSATLTFVREL